MICTFLQELYDVTPRGICVLCDGAMPPRVTKRGRICRSLECKRLWHSVYKVEWRQLRRRLGKCV